VNFVVNKMTVLSELPHPPDAAACELFLSPKLRIALKGTSVNDNNKKLRDVLQIFKHRTSRNGQNGGAMGGLAQGGYMERTTLTERVAVVEK
jgi:hypothetical protein